MVATGASAAGSFLIWSKWIVASCDGGKIVELNALNKLLSDYIH